MTTSTLPEAASLEHLKNQAKALLRAATSGDAGARDRLTAAHPRPIDTPTLADCQLVIAREYGFESWPKLKAHVDEVEHNRAVAEFKAAVERSDAAEVGKLLRKHPRLRRQVDAPLFSFDTPAIVYAAASKNRDLIDTLLEAGANVNVRTSWAPGGFGALDGADAETAAYLISKGAYVDIHAAAKHGMFDRVRELIQQDSLPFREGPGVGSLVNARGGDGQTPLHFASTVEICAYLLDHGADIDTRDIDHHSTAAQYSILNAEKLRYLVDRGAQADIFIACRLGDRKLAADLLTREPDCLRRRLNHPDYSNPAGHIYLYTCGMSVRPITMAVDYGGSDFLQFLLDRTGHVDRLLLGCAMADRAVVDAVLKEHPGTMDELTADDKAFLSDAAWDNRVDAVRTMLDVGWEIDTLGFESSTALNRAAVRGWAPLVQLLVDRGASLEIPNAFGGWPLSAAGWGSENWPKATGDHAACVEILIAAGSKLPKNLYGSAEVQAIFKKHGVGG